MHKKGSPKTGGRQKGTPNKVTVEARAAAALIVDDPAYREMLLKKARAGLLQSPIEALLWHYSKGKPRETIELVDGVLRACEAPGASGEVINVATGGRISLNQLFQTMRDLVGGSEEALWMRRGTSGRSSCTPSSVNWSPTSTPDLLASQVPPARERPSSRCTAPSIWHARIRTAAFFSRRSRSRSRRRFARTSSG
jgi:hypothetical protein